MRIYEAYESRKHREGAPPTPVCFWSVSFLTCTANQNLQVHTSRPFFGFMCLMSSLSLVAADLPTWMDQLQKSSSS